jgi:hypothetical protein
VDRSFQPERAPALPTWDGASIRATPRTSVTRYRRTTLAISSIRSPFIACAVIATSGSQRAVRSGLFEPAFSAVGRDPHLTSGEDAGVQPNEDAIIAVGALLKESDDRNRAEPLRRVLAIEGSDSDSADTN